MARENRLKTVPDLAEETGLLACGYRRIAGVDEAGRGAWAGPVYAAAVVLPLERPDLSRLLADVRDSKGLSPLQREALSARIREVALAVGVGWAEVAEIDALGILPATRRAMARAVGGLALPADALLIDYVRLPEIGLPQRSLPRADACCLSVAAASIIAKVERDRRMTELDREYPGYGFARHKGYGTPQHRRALQQLGPSPIHRRTWRPLAGWTREQDPDRNSLP
jgi:ribonuclease HII